MKLAVCFVVAFLAAPVADVAAGGKILSSRVKAEVDGKNQALLGVAQSMRISSTQRLGGKKADTTRIVGGRSSVIYRRPTKGVARGVLSNRTFQLITAQLGHPELVPAAAAFQLQRAVGEFQAGEEVMLMAYEAAPFRSANEVPVAWLEQVPEDVRQVAAVADLLTQYRDRKLANILIDDNGNLRLIDPDSTFVSRKHRPAYRSQLYLGMRLGHRTPQRTAAELSPLAQALVFALAAASTKDVAHDFGVEKEDAEVLRAQAHNIQEMGLARAADAYVSTLTLKQDH